MESSALEALISKFLEELKSLVGSDSRFDFDEQQVTLVRDTVGQQVVRIYNKQAQDFLLIKCVRLGASHVAANLEKFKGVNSASCPNVATIIDSIKAQDGSYWIFIDDGPESEKLSYLIEERGAVGKTFSEGELTHLTLDMALGLAHLQLLGLTQHNVRPRAFFRQAGSYKVTDLALTPVGLDKTAIMFASPNTVNAPTGGFQAFREDAHALGRIILLMMQVGGTQKCEEEWVDSNRRHYWDKTETHWVNLVQPYAEFSHGPSPAKHKAHIQPLLDQAKRCGRYSDLFISLVENLVAYEPDERFDFFSIVRILRNYKKWDNTMVGEVFGEERALAAERASGDIELLKEQNDREEYLHLARFSSQEEIETHKQEIEEIIAQIEAELEVKREKHSEVDDFCQALQVDEDAKGNQELTLGPGQFFSGKLNSENLPHGIGKLTQNDGTYVYVGEWEDGRRKGRGKLTDGNYVYMGFFENDKRQGWGMEEFVGDSEWAGDRFEGDFVNDVRHGVGQYTYENGDLFVGRYENGLREGIGKREVIDSYEYKGMFNDGRMEGWGIMKIAESGDVYEGQFKADMRHGYGSYQYADGDRYLGQFANGKQEGKGHLEQMGEGYEYIGDWKEDAVDGWGVQKWEDGERYEGEFQTDERHGFGRWVTGENIKYEGFFATGVRQGYGEFQKPNGYKYDGNWIADKKTGCGFETKPNDNTYKGEFSEDKHQGFGVQRIELTGEIYEGHFFANIRQGKGKFTLPDGYMYDGMWDKGHATGYGIEVQPSGERYEGEFIKMVRDGQGKCWFTEGSVYEGAWDNGLQHGQGTLTKPDGYRYEGDWVEGGNTGKGKEWWPNGERYEGDFVQGIRHGKGVYFYANGDVYTGDFEQGVREGIGKLEDKTGYSYQGDWREDRANGKGIQKWADGDCYEGDFVDDVRHGVGRYTYNNGSYYDGDWREGVKEGNGRMEIVDYYEYDGEWRGDLKHGKGRQVWVGACEWAGDHYNGDYYQGLRHGYGVYNYANGDVYEGGWVGGKREGKGMLKQKSGYEYEGDWKQDVEHGVGVQRWIGEDQEWRGEDYEGQMAAGFREGKGVYRYKNGDEYDGSWMMGRRDGDGRLWSPETRTLYEGQWEEGLKNGKGELKIMKEGEGHAADPEESYIGNFRNDKQDGEGVYSYTDRSRYEGYWKNGLRDGLGKQFDTEGNLEMEGVWDQDTYAGKVTEERMHNLLKEQEAREEKQKLIQQQQYLSPMLTPVSQIPVQRDHFLIETEENSAPRGFFGTLFCCSR